ncbi:hypothetical protein [Staphylococcus hominis]|uniref:hypothetical protein n=1 Tax=Staphylococcus hominis TaxID=1290 RepID=UPI001F567639|nr:hypothetical protein [Staphylococcus hominis]MCI2913501.1 hypothetical protein [Staphylococcus hominis]
MENLTVNEEIVDIFNSFNLEVPNIPVNRQYWLVRTEGGDWYEEFTKESFIAIGWNEIDKSDYLQSVNRTVVEKIISEHYPESKQHSLIINNIDRFYNKMKIGDIVLIPSEGSKYITFAEITSDVFLKEVSETQIDEGYCSYSKRREIKTLKTIPKNDLDLKLFKMLQSRHTISNINDYAREIDSSLYDFYIKGERIIYSIKINKKRELTAENIRTLANIPWIANEYIDNDYYHLSELISTIYVKSPGKQEFEGKGKNGAKFLIGMAIAVVGLFGGNIEIGENKFESHGIFEKSIKEKELELEKTKEKNRHQEEMEKLKNQGEAEAPDINKYKKTSN